MKAHNAVTVIEYMKPIIQRTVIQKLDISVDSPLIIRACLNVFKKKHISKIVLSPLETGTGETLWACYRCFNVLF